MERVTTLVKFVQKVCAPDCCEDGEMSDDGATDHGDRPERTRLVLIRHGESNVTVKRLIGGHRSCTGLSDLGRTQAARLRDRLAETHELDGAVLISSAFDRALETAQIIGPAIAGSDLVVDPGFGEHDPGPELDGMSFADYLERFGSPNWGGDPHFGVFPGGETIAAFHLRVGATLSKTLQRYAGQTIVVACHGGVVDAVFRQLLHLPPTGGFDLWTSNTSLTEFVQASDSVSHEPRWRLARYNDAAHLAGLPESTNTAQHPPPAADS